MSVLLAKKEKRGFDKVIEKERSWTERITEISIRQYWKVKVKTRYGKMSVYINYTDKIDTPQKAEERASELITKRWKVMRGTTESEFR